MTRSRALLPAALLLAACGRFDEVDITRSTSGTVPGAAASRPLAGGMLGALDLVVDRGTLDAHGIQPDDVDSARLKGLRLEVTEGTSIEAWLEAVSFYVEAPGLPRVLVARRDRIGTLPAGTTAIELETPGVDLKPYILAPSGTVMAEVSGTQPPVDTTVLATATIRVNVNASGLLR